MSERQKELDNKGQGARRPDEAACLKRDRLIGGFSFFSFPELRFELNGERGRPSARLGPMLVSVSRVSTWRELTMDGRLQTIGLCVCPNGNVGAISRLKCGHAKLRVGQRVAELETQEWNHKEAALGRLRLRSIARILARPTRPIVSKCRAHRPKTCAGASESLGAHCAHSPDLFVSLRARRLAAVDDAARLILFSPLDARPQFLRAAAWSLFLRLVSSRLVSVSVSLSFGLCAASSSPRLPLQTCALVVAMAAAAVV